jgi:hypothetical protein
MKVQCLPIIIISLITCTNRLSDVSKGVANDTRKTWTLPVISAIDAKFPLSLKDINLHDNSTLVVMNDGITSRIQKTILDYYLNECAGDSSETNFTVKDTYINTIRLRDSLQTIFLVLLDHIPSGLLNGKLLFYDNMKKDFADKPLDFNLYALYSYENGILTTSNLKTELNITKPEIELVDFDKNGINDFKLNKLVHNGTLNATENLTVKISGHKIDTLDFKEEILKIKY